MSDDDDASVPIIHERTGYKIGFKPAGGISNAKTALVYQAPMKDELGDDWLDPSLFRFGASSLLLDIERQLHHAATRYSFPPPLTARRCARHSTKGPIPSSVLSVFPYRYPDPYLH